jgi:hypothetical protein
MNYKSPLRPDRIRTIEKPFAWIPFRLLKDGLFAELSDNAKLLYTFLCLAADRQGLSYYGDPKIQTHFDLNQIEIDQARKELIQKDLLAYDGHLYQLLSLPNPKPATIFPSPKNTEPERFSVVLKRLAEQSTR